MKVRMVARIASTALPRQRRANWRVSTSMSITLLALIVGAVLDLVSGSAARAYSARVTGVYYLKIRRAPSFDAREIGVLEAGAVVEVVSEAGPWVAVELRGGKTGYVSRKYLVTLGAGAERTPVPGPALEPATVEGAPAAVAAPDGTPGGTVMITGESSESPTASKEARPGGGGALAKPAPARKQGPDGCTKADLEAMNRRLDELVTAQEHLADVVREAVRSRAAATQDRARGPSLSTRQVAFWLGVGCIVGWAAAGSYRRRRQRNRIRI